MWPAIILVILLFFVLLMLLLVFIQDIIIVGINLLIIYLAGLRSIVEIKKGQGQNYIIGAIISGLILLGWRNVFPLWAVTAFVFQTFVIAQVVRIARKFLSKKSKKKRK